MFVQLEQELLTTIYINIRTDQIILVVKKMWLAISIKVHVAISDKIA